MVQPRHKILWPHKAKEQWRGREREADRGNKGQTVQRNGQGTTCRDPGTGTQPQQMEETDQCTPCWDGTSMPPPRIKGARQDQLKTAYAGRWKRKRGGREREADRGNDGQILQRNGQGNHLQRPRHWHTTTAAADGGDWCTACQYSTPTNPP